MRKSGWTQAEVIVVLVIIAFGAALVAPNIGVADCEFVYRKSITVQSGQVSGGPHTNFPMLVNISSDNDLRTTANGGHVTNSNGYDIIFRGLDDTTCGGTGTAPCTLSHEIERYTASSGQLVAWVKVPSINNGTVIYMYYGNSCISSSTANANGVWDDGGSANFRFVLHLSNDSFSDSTSYGNNGTNSGTTDTTGKIYGGRNFDGTDDYIEMGSASNIDNIFDGGGTFSAWIYPVGWGENDYGRIADKTPSDVDGRNGWSFFLDNYGTRLRCIRFLKGFSSALGAWETGTDTISLNQWQHVAVVYNQSSAGNDPIIYINGSSQTVYEEYSPSGSAQSDADQNLRIGNLSGATTRTFDGVIDEIRLSKTMRSTGWIQTEYNNQSAPSSFYSVGSEQGSTGSPAPTYVKLKSFTATQYEEGVLLRWRTGYEVNNLGFYLYREENGQLVRLTPEPVAGSAFLAGSRTALRAGHHYHWWDTSVKGWGDGEIRRSGDKSAIRYWLKDIDLSGKETMHGPVYPVLSRDPIPEKFNPELLSEVGWRLNERYEHYWKARELKEKLKDRGASRLRRGLRSGLSGLEDRPWALRQKNFGLLTSSEAFLKRSAPEGNFVPDPQAQWYLASRPAVKLLVRQEGWYRVTQSELVAAGLSPKANPRLLQLYTEGIEQPIKVIGKGLKFEAIEFYGIGLDTPSTDTRVYWLIEGSRPGKRITPPYPPLTNGGDGGFLKGGSLESTSFPYTVEKKERTIYFAALRNGEEENFFGPVVYMNRVDQILELLHLDRSAPQEALLEVNLQGATEGSHRVKVLLNEAEVGEISFQGQSRGILRVEISQSMLEEGENLVSLVAMGGEIDATLLETIRLTYWHRYMADKDILRFTAQGGSHLTINGFSDSKIRVFDISDSDEVMEVIGKVGIENGGYAVSFRVPGADQRRLLALTEERVKSPAEVVFNHPSSWHQEARAYDLVIISHWDFMDELEPLKQLRESQGLRVVLIDIEDLYDEFGFGSKSPHAIKDFLAHAKTKWKTAPRFVLLVGDASLDPRNYLGLGEMDFVPTKLIDTLYLETASDDWFVDFNNDGLPEMAIGRLPVQTKEEAALVVSKIIGYERSNKNQEALLVADRSDNPEEFNFEGASEELKALLPASLMVRRIYRGQFSSDAQAKGELLAGINQGALLVNFIGHGSVEGWRGSLLTLEDAEDLINGYKLSFFVNMTCLNGFFQNPYGETLAEALIKATGGGAIAVWTSSGLTEPDRQVVMNKELIKLLFGGGSLTLGEATAKAKASVSDQDIRRTWILFGDPSLQLGR
ncbi:MAG: DUF2341 domain-containing protein [Thermodesulfobacteriota bacterium]